MKRGEAFELIALHTPGHARGHLCFYDAAKGFLLSSDNVVGTGSVVIAPPEGNLVDYLNSLERMKNLSNLNISAARTARRFSMRGRKSKAISRIVWSAKNKS